MSKSVKLENLSDVIKQELTIYSQSITEAIKTQAQTSMKELVKETKKTAPVGKNKKREKRYKNSIKSTKLEETSRGVTYVWFVESSNAGLTHLLDKGHALRTGGRVRGTHFLTNASEKIIQNYEEKIEEAIKNGG